MGRLRLVCLLMTTAMPFSACQDSETSSQGDIQDISHADGAYDMGPMATDSAPPPRDAGPSSDSTLLDAALGDPLDSGVLPEDAEVNADVGVNTPCQNPSAVLEHVTWGPVLRSKCFECHKPGGYARGCNEGQFCANFELNDPFAPGVDYEAVMATNLTQVLANIERVQDGDDHLPKLLLKATGRRGHGGGEVVLPPGGEDGESEDYQALERLVDALERWDDETCVESATPVDELLNQVRYASPSETWRRITIQIAGRLPTAQERATLAEAEAGAAKEAVLERLFDGLRDEAGTHRWLKEVWNEIFMFRGAYEIFYADSFSIFSIHDFAARMWADMRIFHPRTVRQTDEGGYEMVSACEGYAEDFGYPSYPGGTAVDLCRSRDFTRNGIGHWVKYGAVESPLELIAHIIKSERPFSDVLTTTEVMMNYYTANAYFGPNGAAQEYFADAPMLDGLKVDREPGSPTVSMPDHRYFLPIDDMRMTYLRAPEFPDADQAPPDCLNNDGDVKCRLILPKPTTQYARAGIITTPVFMSRFPSNAFNRNRHRAWQALRLFLDLDVLEGTARTVNITDHNGDAFPTFSDPSCSGCHETLDPIAGLFQSFNVTEGAFQGDVPPPRRRILWPLAGADADGDGDPDPGFHVTGAGTVADGEVFDDETESSMVQFLARKLVADHRFAPAMVSHAWTQVFGHGRPTTLRNPAGDNFNERAALIAARRQFYSAIVGEFRGDGLNMWSVYRTLFLSSWYRVDGVDPAVDEVRLGTFDDLVRAGPSTPEHFMRRVEAVLGRPWPHRAAVAGYTTPSTVQDDFLLRTDSAKAHLDLLFGLVDADFASFFGGVDFLNTTQRAPGFNSVMSLVVDRVTNEFACVSVAYDLSQPTEERTFFSRVASDEVYDATDPDVDARFRQTIVDLFHRVLGVSVRLDSLDVDEVLALWETARQVAVERYGDDRVPLLVHCRPANNGPDGGDTTFDSRHVIRSWMAVMTYLVRQPEFILWHR